MEWSFFKTLSFYTLLYLSP